MVQFIEPEYSKRRVNKAGNGRRADNRGDLQSFDEYLESWRIIENWRACHAYVLNTFQTNLRDRAKKGKDIVVAQRLKRRVTIVDKLNRHPNMQLSRMNDIAGCRVIFPDEISLFDFRASLHTSRAKHILRNRGDG